MQYIHIREHYKAVQLSKLEHDSQIIFFKRWMKSKLQTGWKDYDTIYIWQHSLWFVDTQTCSKTKMGWNEEFPIISKR